jgi:hypothetical protein
MRIVTWNLGRSPAETPAAVEVIRRIAAERPDIACMTETQAGSPAGLNTGGVDGHVIDEAGARLKGDAETDRKVVLWSKEPWRDVVRWPHLSELGGAVSGITTSPLGPVRVIGLCAPWHMAWPANAQTRPLDWEMNTAFFERLKGVLKDIDAGKPLVVCGRMCQYVPLSRGNWTAHHAMTSALSGLGLATRGDIPPTSEQTTDHVAISSQLRASEVRLLDRKDAGGDVVAEDAGVLVALQAGGVAIFD